MNHVWVVYQNGTDEIDSMWLDEREARSRYYELDDAWDEECERNGYFLREKETGAPTLTNFELDAPPQHNTVYVVYTIGSGVTNDGIMCIDSIWGTGENAGERLSKLESAFLKECEELHCSDDVIEAYAPGIEVFSVK